MNSAGNQVTSTSYGPYGTASTAVLAVGAPTSAIGYAGSYALPGGTGLDDMRARSYNPVTGTFASADPMVAISSQPYAYADGDPIGSTDPSGAITCPSWLPGCGVVTDFQHGAAQLARAWWKEWWTDNPCGNAAAALAPAFTRSSRTSQGL